MQKAFRKTVLAAGITAAMLAASVPAHACCGDGAIAAKGAAAAGMSISESIAEAVVVVVSWLERVNTTVAAGFGKVSAEIQRQTASIRTMHEGNAAVAAQLHMEKARADAAIRYEPSPRMCYEAAGGAATGIASSGTSQVLADLNSSFATRTLFAVNTSAVVSKLYDEHATKYCSQQDTDLGRCNAVDPRLQNADVRADLVFNMPSYSLDQLAAAQAFAHNVTNPVPTQNIPSDWEKTPQGKAFVAGQYIEQARASVAANSLNRAIAIRTPTTGLGTAAMLNKADVSELELMESQVRGRFESPPWYKMIASFSVENLLREGVKMSALDAWMKHKEYLQMERVEVILATQLAIDVKRDSEQRLREARLAASKAGQ